MERRFSSKVDAWLGAAILVAIAGSGFASAVAYRGGGFENTLVAITVLLAGALFPLWLCLSTNYIVRDDLLLIRCGPFSWRVPKATIRSVKATRNPLSSPALSLDRLRIDYGAGKYVMVSPANPSEFRKALGFTETS